MSVCQNVPRSLPEHDRKLGITGGRKRKETYTIHKKQKHFRSYPRENHPSRRTVQAPTTIEVLFPPLSSAFPNKFKRTRVKHRPGDSLLHHNRCVSGLSDLKRWQFSYAIVMMAPSKKIREMRGGFRSCFDLFVRRLRASSFPAAHLGNPNKFDCSRFGRWVESEKLQVQPLLPRRIAVLSD